MAQFVPMAKLSKKARKARNDLKRQTWDISPATRKVESKKAYNRKKSLDRYDDYGRDFFICSDLRRSLPEIAGDIWLQVAVC